MGNPLRDQLATERGRPAFGLLPLAVPGRPSVDYAMAMIKLALDAGVRLIDTADIYGLQDEPLGYTERLLGDLLGHLPQEDRPIVTTKGGMVHLPSGRRGCDGRPEHLHRACRESLRRLGTDAIDIYQLHRPDPGVPYADSLGALRELVDQGLIRGAGVDNVDAVQFDQAGAVLGDDLVLVQNRFSVEDHTDTEVLSRCVRRGVAYAPCEPLGGLGRGSGLAERRPALGRLARRRNVSAQRVALAWLLTRHPYATPVIGTSNTEHLLDALEAGHLQLSDADLEELAA
ncbi:aryl-alcohol dehydrogenase-like predicted oxidoreductase [Micromonospora sp. Llam0]|nr:aryl-alcohol dehydrogenase-like predicted oxidoreductase [Micromonospora sp. Llam0]